MNKKILLGSLVVIIIGAVGVVWTGFHATSGLYDYVQRRRTIESKENKFYEKRIDINKLVIDCKDTNVNIKTNDRDCVDISENGAAQNVNYKVSDDNKTLKIEELKYDFKREAYSFDVESIVKEFIKSKFERQQSSITVYLPKKVDLNISVDGGNLNIKDDVFLNEFKLSSNVFISANLPSKIQNLNNFDINSERVSLSLEDILNIKNINIESDDVYISSDKNAATIENVEDLIPDNIKIYHNNLNEDSNKLVTISSNLPIAKNLDINVPDGLLKMNLPTDKYKFNYDIHSPQNEDYNYYTDFVNDKKPKKIDLKGLANDQLSKLDKQYNISAKAGYIQFK